MIYIVLIEPEIEGNIGAVARAMKNFGLKELILINPKADHTSDETRCRAKHAQDIIDNAKVKDIAFLNSMDYIFGTTAKLGTNYNIPRTPITPEKMASMLTPKRKYAILLGRESIGLTNEEIELCDMIVSIPSSKAYPVLNLSHAVTILCYEIFKARNSQKTAREPIRRHEKDILLRKFDSVLDSIHFSTPDKRATQKIVWKRIINQSQLMRREAFAVFGLLDKVDLSKIDERKDHKRHDHKKH